MTDEPDWVERIRELTRPEPIENDFDFSDYITVGTGRFRRFELRSDLPLRPVEVKYHYKLCGDFSDIREFLDIVDRDEDCAVTTKQIHTVENTDNQHTTEYEFTSYNDRMYLQGIIEQCTYPEDMALLVVKN